MMQIRDNKYYREQYGTFEQYCKERWGMSKTHANRLISSAEVVDNLTPMGVISERAIRPLTKIKDPDQQREVYEEAVETAPEGLPSPFLLFYAGGNIFWQRQIMKYQGVN